jgi:hypothetical protein
MDLKNTHLWVYEGEINGPTLEEVLCISFIHICNKQICKYSVFTIRTLINTVQILFKVL